MKERPILFSTEMVRAILDGRKTQTRRVMKPQPPEGYRPGFSFFTSPGEYEIRDNTGNFAIGKVPYGAKGDRLWVKETWCPVDDTEFGGKQWVDYRATPWDSAEQPAGWQNAPNDEYALKWRPSIFMPRWASRITLEIKNIRVERVQEITEDDVVSEGADYELVPYIDHNTGEHLGNQPSYRLGFKRLWDSINAKRGYGWNVNPWVWVIEFEVVKCQ